jgi:lysophospholipase L1-like esterase
MPANKFIRNGVCGNTVKKATERIDNFTNSLVNGKRPNVTFFMFGINDSLYDDETKYVLPEKFKENYICLLEKFIERK